MTWTTDAEPQLNRTRAGSGTSSGELLSAFARLDRRLKLLLDEARDPEGWETDAPPYPGLLIGRSEIERLLDRKWGEPEITPGATEFCDPLYDLEANPHTRLSWLAREYELSSFDIDVIVIALAPELDLRYERIYAYLQDDITCKRPSVNLALDLLCASAGAKLSRLDRLTADAPLVKNRLLRLVPDPDEARPDLSHALRLDRQVVALLLDRRALDARLSLFCRLIDPAESPQDAPVSRDPEPGLLNLLTEARAAGQALKLHFHGPSGAGKRRMAEMLAARVGAELLVVELEPALAGALDFEQALNLIFREARFRHAVLYFEDFDALLGEERVSAYRQFLRVLKHDPGITILASETPHAATINRSIRIYETHFPVRDFAGRRACWDENLRRHGAALCAAELDALAGAFRLTDGEIAAAVTMAATRATLRAATQSSRETLSPLHAALTTNELFACARARLNHNLGSFARRIEPKYDWTDIVLPADQLIQLREICNQYRHRHVVYGEWGFDRKLSRGKGLNVLFSGHPGTGKTMAAEVIANELRLELYRIDLSQVVSKYIGETEKSLSRIFREAQASSAILFFDEADALFGKRTEVKDAHDRYANIEVSYLLQRMEEYDGVAILATNLRQNIDEAFLRRVQFIVEFPFPDEEHRRRIWKVAFPPTAPLASDVDLDFLARAVRLTGGNIKNIGLAAAFYAAGDGRVIRHEHLIRAARREFQKLGRNWNERDWKTSEASSAD